jgi:pimeloyl-ACP methyl ester carboxylesterase
MYSLSFHTDLPRGFESSQRTNQFQLIRSQHRGNVRMKNGFYLMRYSILPLHLLFITSTLAFVLKPSLWHFSHQERSDLWTTLLVTDSTISCPAVSPATGLHNRFYNWKNGQKIRYQSTESSATALSTAPILLVHGLFTNSDHWRRTLNFFKSSDQYTAYALDLYGCGYSDKPLPDSDVAQACNGESHRFNKKDPSSGVLRNIQLGTPDGRIRSTPRDIDLCHPTGSPYNFYTWADVIADFCRDIILPNHTVSAQSNGGSPPTVTLVANSIGTMSSLQAVLDHNSLFNGVFVICPNFRELHSAEVSIPSITMPIVRFQQRLLRDVIGQPLFHALAKPEIVRFILKTPYAVKDAVDDELVHVLLDPLLTPGSSNVVFDTLSYSAGPLPEPLLQQLSAATTVPVWVCYGADDPWTPGPRVQALSQFGSCVKKIVTLPGVGHCPHDEAPELVHPLLMDFLHNCVANYVSSR